MQAKELKIQIVLGLILLLGLSDFSEATTIEDDWWNESSILSDNSNSMVIDNIEYYFQTDKSVYDLGENVECLFKITNKSVEEKRFDYMGPFMDILIYAKEGNIQRRIWNWSWDKSFPAGPRVYVMTPGEIITLNCTWTQINLNNSIDPKDHTPVSEGLYSISGLLTPTGIETSIDISIVPEPGSLVLFITGAFVLLRNQRQSYKSERIKIQNCFRTGFSSWPC